MDSYVFFHISTFSQVFVSKTACAQPGGALALTGEAATRPEPDPHRRDDSGAGQACSGITRKPEPSDASGCSPGQWVIAAARSALPPERIPLCPHVPRLHAECPVRDRAGVDRPTGLANGVMVMEQFLSQRCRDGHHDGPPLLTSPRRPSLTHWTTVPATGAERSTRANLTWRSSSTRALYFHCGGPTQMIPFIKCDSMTSPNLWRAGSMNGRVIVASLF